MTRNSKMALVSLVALAAVAMSGAIGSPAHARSGGAWTFPMERFMQSNGMRMHANTRDKTVIQYSCAGSPGYRCYEQPEPQPLHAEPGTFWHAISICDYLAGTGISCVYDPNYLDDNN